MKYLYYLIGIIAVVLSLIGLLGGGGLLFLIPLVFSGIIIFLGLNPKRINWISNTALCLAIITPIIFSFIPSCTRRFSTADTVVDCRDLKPILIEIGVPGIFLIISLFKKPKLDTPN